MYKAVHRFEKTPAYTVLWISDNNNVKNLPIMMLHVTNRVCKLVKVQGVSKRSLKVHVSISTIIYGARDLKFYMDKLQNYTIWYIR